MRSASLKREHLAKSWCNAPHTDRSYNLGDLEFRTKADCSAFVSAWLLSVTGEHNVGPEDREWIMALLTRHPRWADKCGGRPDPDIVVCKPRRQDSKLSYNCFHVRVADGSLVDVSYRKCLMAHLSSPFALSTQAFRNAISDQTTAFMRRTLETARASGTRLVCPRTGDDLGDQGDVVVDHHSESMPFKKLLADFCASDGCDIDRIDTRCADDGCGRLLSDPLLCRRWQAYHATHAQLRLVRRFSEKKSDDVVRHVVDATT